MVLLRGVQRKGRRTIFLSGARKKKAQLVGIEREEGQTRKETMRLKQLAK